MIASPQGSRAILDIRRSVEVDEVHHLLFVSRIECREIDVGSALFAGEQALRDAVLRAPLGREPSATMIDRDRTGRHFVALAGGAVIGCVGLYPCGIGTAVLRHLAVAEDARRHGVARQLVAFAEASVARDGVRHVDAEARLEAIPFYEAAGYAAFGDVYVRHGVSHRAVSKRLDEAIVDRE